MRRVAILCAVVGLIVFGWRWWFPSDEAQIRAVLSKVEDALSAPSEGGALATAARVAALQQEFATDVVVEAGPPFQRLVGRQEVISAAGRLSVSVYQLEVRFPEVDVTVGEDGRTATAIVAAEAHFNETGGGRTFEARELEMTFTRNEERWVIASVALIQPLERLDK
jgi:hypothetical protein